MIEQVQLSIKRGDSITYTLYFTDEDGGVIDISGYVVFFTVKENIDDIDDPESGEEITAKIVKDIISHIDATNGKTQITLSSENTNQKPGSYLFDIQIKKDTLEINTILEGIITITKDVTMRTS